MSKIAVVVDSSTILSERMLSHPDVYVVNVKIAVDTVEVENFTKDDLFRAFEKEQRLQTSQPSIQEASNLFTDLLEKDYEHIMVLSISKELSGTYNGFTLAARLSDDSRLEVFDTQTIAGAIGYMVECVIDASEKNHSYNSIKKMLEQLTSNTMAFLFPQSLKRLMLSGRVNKAVGTFSDFLKLKIVLVLRNKGSQIEKFDIVRTETRAFSKMMDAFSEFGVNSKEYLIMLMSIDESAPITKLKKAIFERFSTIELRQIELPIVLASHGGLGVVAIQCIKKIAI